ncbi:hypothetical protein EXE57_06330 [Nocardioides euryhalodurans]|uniref:Uncharacterized protein n=1 Tax=Nocardioides euryhalodurans TaxID=2518370 RepID=A0A4V1BEE6_9ACTN|nr:hypothetical protein EXE57_06330 [Nocardioides euryhalodurans]
MWRPDEPTYDAFVLHLRTAADFPTYLPWPLGPGWAVSDFAVVAEEGGRPSATLTCVSGTSELDGPVDALVVAEEVGVGLGARCAGVPGGDPGRALGDTPPVVRVRIGSALVPLWSVSTSQDVEAPELDRTVLAGEAAGRWLWIVLRPATAMLLMRDDWILRDVSGLGPSLVAMPFAGPGPGW